MFYHKYLFFCKECSNEFEVECGIESIIGLKTACPICFSENVRRKYAIPNISFNGNGFYSTDSRKKHE